jgi:hypothetical protein
MATFAAAISMPRRPAAFSIPSTAIAEVKVFPVVTGTSTSLTISWPILSATIEVKPPRVTIPIPCFSASLQAFTTLENTAQASFSIISGIKVATMKQPFIDWLVLDLKFRMSYILNAGVRLKSWLKNSREGTLLFGLNI